MDETKITAQLPNLSIEIDHRADNGAETLVIRLTGAPDFAQALPLAEGMVQALAQGQMMAFPLAGGQMMAYPWMAPLAFWTQAMQACLQPWTALLTPPGK